MVRLCVQNDRVHKLASIAILALSMINLVPPMFKSSGVFGFLSYDKITMQNGKHIIEKIDYFDNVYFAILYFTLGFVSIILPFMVPNLNKTISRLSFLCSGWFTAGFVFELINFSTPDLVLNSSENSLIYIKCLVGFTLAVITTLTSEAWIKQKKSNS